MLKLIGLVCTSMFLLSSATPQNSEFPAYKAVEVYEIRPGILMMPTYADNGQICEIGIEKRNYSLKLVRLDPSLSRKQIDEIFDELVPPNERGPKSKDILGELLVYTGPSITETVDFENVSMQIFSETLTGSKNRKFTIDNIVATIKWKNRTCHERPQ
jgi:hypothetical protein